MFPSETHNINNKIKTNTVTIYSSERLFSSFQISKTAVKNPDSKVFICDESSETSDVTTFRKLIIFFHRRIARKIL